MWHTLVLFYYLLYLQCSPLWLHSPSGNTLDFFGLGISTHVVPFNPYPFSALNNILIISVIKMQKQGKLGNFLVLWESWCQAISCGLNDNCSLSASVKADILTSSSKVDCLTSCGFPDRMQPFWYHALDILHVSCC